MFFAGTKMHLVTFGIVAFELVMLVVQVIYFLQRPNDKKRLWYLILLVFLILYNVCSGLFPDKQFVIPITIQTIIAYLVGFSMSMYVIYYFYKVFELKHLKFFVTYGILLFLVVPFIFLFIVPYLLTGDSRLSSKLTVIIPFFYGLSFIYCSTRALIKKFREARLENRILDDPLYEHAVVAYISMLCWAALPVIVFFGDFQVLEHSVTNAGFMFMTVIYVRSAIKQSRQEYQRLLESEKNLKELNNNLQHKVKERTKSLEELNTQQTNTFINLAHETKTPLTLINNYLSEYEQKHGSNEELNVIKYNINRLTSDIVNFFDLERFKRGFGVYDHNEISSFSCLLSAKLCLFALQARNSSIRLEQNIEPELLIKASASAIERIINNLIENAIRHSGNDGVLKVALKAVEGELIFTVADSGKGIPKDQQKKIFEPYFQLGDHQQSNEGMGLGLSIVKKVVDGLGGSISLSSEVNIGTTIEVRLKQHVGKAEHVKTVCPSAINFAETPKQLDDSVSESAKASVLLVEDNLAMLGYLSNKLKSRYNVYLARNGSEAITKLKAIAAVDLIVSDVMMENLDGFELCKILSRHPKFSHIPLIFLTAKSTNKDKLSALKLGAIDFIEKPFVVDQLLQKIECVISLSAKQRLAAFNDRTNTNADVKLTSTSQISFSENCISYGLSVRETEIAGLILQGLNYREIGERLFISTKTVNAHVTHIFEKCEVKTKIALVNKLSLAQKDIRENK
ncbi:ATP-binding protein [Chryseosolibacter indicus]|nr:ATP-binding protein [Chryseosolibacter indicus]